MKKIFTLIIVICCFNNLKAQCDYANFSDAPEELFRKRVKEMGMRYGNPYTMFVRGDNFNLDTTLSQIRKNIKTGQPFADFLNIKNDYARLYFQLYQYAHDNVEPGKCPENAECAHPVWVKNNAIVYLIGLKLSIVSGKYQFDSMTPTERDSFFNRAHGGLRNLNPEVISCWGGSDCGKVHFKAGQLVQYLASL